MNGPALPGFLVSGPALVDAAMPHVDSASIREWVNTPNNRPVWDAIAQRAIDKRAATPAGARVGTDAELPLRFATYIMLTAMSG